MPTSLSRHDLFPDHSSLYQIDKMLAGAAGMVICRPLLLSLFLRGGGTPGKCPLSDGDLQELAPPLPPSLQRLLRCGGGDGSASASCGDGECGAEFRESFQGDADPAFRRQGRCCWALGSGLFSVCLGTGFFSCSWRLHQTGWLCLRLLFTPKWLFPGSLQPSPAHTSLF